MRHIEVSITNVKHLSFPTTTTTAISFNALPLRGTEGFKELQSISFWHIHISGLIKNRLIITKSYHALKFHL